MGWLTYLKATSSSIPTPSTGKVSQFVDSADGVPKYKDETGAVTALTGPTGATGAAGNSLNRPVATLTPASGVATINVTTGSEVYILTLAANVTSWVFNNLPAAGTVAEIRIKIIQAASGGPYTCVSPATAGNTAGGAWVNSSAASAIESIGLAIDSSGNVAVFPSGVYA